MNFIPLLPLVAGAVAVSKVIFKRDKKEDIDSIEYKMNEGLQEVFTKTNLGIIEDEVLVTPRLSYIEKEDNRFFAYYTTPYGIGLRHFKERQEYIEQYIGYHVDITRTINKIKIQVLLNDLPESMPYDLELIKTYQRSLNYKIPIFLGIADNQVLCYDMMDSHYHLCIAGSSGRGKSNLLRVVITSIVTLTSPKYNQLLLVDLKGGTEAMLYESLPHVKAIVENIDDTLNLLNYLDSVLNKRLEFLKNNRCVSTKAYNESCINKNKIIPNLILVMDELGDINPDEAPKPYNPKDKNTEKGKRESCQSIISSIARKGRSCGIFLILATQRADGNVIPKQIINNISVRVCFKVGDEYSSELLLGKGDIKAYEIDSNIVGRAIYKFDEDLEFQSFLLSEQDCTDIFYKELKIEPLSNIDFEDIESLTKGIPFTRAYKE